MFHLTILPASKSTQPMPCIGQRYGRSLYVSKSLMMHTEPELWPTTNTRVLEEEVASAAPASEDVSLWGSPILSLTKGTQKDSRALYGSGKSSQITCNMWRGRTRTDVQNVLTTN